MRNHEALDDEDCRRAEALARDADRLPCVRSGAGTRRYGPGRRRSRRGHGRARTVLLQTMRPFLTRAADAIMARIDFAGWRSGYCPLCGGEPDLCGHHAGGRAHPDLRPLRRPLAVRPAHLPVLPERGPPQITSFASRDGHYRLYACDVCERYLKAYDARQRVTPGHAGRRWSRHAAAGRGRHAEGVQVGAGAVRAGQLLGLLREDDRRPSPTAS